MVTIKCHDSKLAWGNLPFWHENIQMNNPCSYSQMYVVGSWVKFTSHTTCSTFSNRKQLYYQNGSLLLFNIKYAKVQPILFIFCFDCWWNARCVLRTFVIMIVFYLLFRSLHWKVFVPVPVFVKVVVVVVVVVTTSLAMILELLG